MKTLRFLLVLLLVLGLSFPCFGAARPNSQKGIYFVQALTGGAQGALDALDHTGDGDGDVTDGTPNRYDLADGDAAIYVVVSGTTVTFYVYGYDADGTQEESSPTVIRPDTYSTQGNWILHHQADLLDSDLDGVITDEDFYKQILLGDTSIIITDTGSDGTITIKVDNTTVMTITDDAVSIGPLAYDADITSGYSGHILDGLEAGESIDAGDVVFVASDGDLEQYDADADGPVGAVGLALETGASGEIAVLREGFYYSATHGITVGNRVCASETAGNFEDCATTAAAWGTDGDVLHEIGLSVSANVIYFDFGKLAVVHE